MIFLLVKWYNLKIIFYYNHLRIFSFIVIPAYLNLFETISVFLFNWFSLVAHAYIVLVTNHIFIYSPKTCSRVLWNMSLSVFIPYGILLHFSNPICVFIVVTSLKLSSIGIWLCAIFKYIFVKTFIPASAWIASSTLGIGYESEQTLRFTPILSSPHIRMSPSDFLKTTMGDAHLLPIGGTCSRKSRSMNFRSFATTNGNKCTGNFRGSNIFF